MPVHPDHYDFRPIAGERLADVAALVGRMTKKKRPTSYYLQKYAAPLSEGKCLGWLAYANEHPVSVVGALTFEAVLPDGARVPVAHIIESFTLPAHSGRGLMTRLIRKTMEDLSQQGVRLFYVLPNQYHGFLNKLGFRQVGQMTWFELPVSVIPVEALCRRLGLNAWYRRWARHRIMPYRLAEGAILENAVLSEGFGGVVHDRKFFQYKTFSYNAFYRLAGVECWLKFESGLLVGDVSLPESLSNAQVESWLAALGELARRAGLRKVLFQAQPGTRLYKVLKTRLPPQPSWVVCCRTEVPEWQEFLPQMRFGYGDFDTF